MEIIILCAFLVIGGIAAHLYEKHMLKRLEEFHDIQDEIKRRIKENDQCH